MHFEERCSVGLPMPFQVMGVLLCGNVLSPTRPQGRESCAKSLVLGSQGGLCMVLFAQLVEGKDFVGGILWGAQKLNHPKGKVPQGTPLLAASPLRSPRGPAWYFIGMDI